MTKRPWFRIGTRGSPLALTQTHEARRLIAEAHGAALEDIDVAIIRTTGDRILDRPLAEAGGKGLFTKELDVALGEGRIDCAVHSAKDLPTLMPDGLTVAGYLPREDVRDVFVSRRARDLADLPAHASFGSASPRRVAQALRLRPDLRPTLLRGNVETRLRKAESGEIDATILAAAGLRRLGLIDLGLIDLGLIDLGLIDHGACFLDIDAFLPAPGQGAVAITIRSDDQAMRERLMPALDPRVGAAVTAERAFLAVLDASCRTPVAALARHEGDRLHLRAAAYRPDGSQMWDMEGSGARDAAEAIGARVGRALLAQLPPDFFIAPPPA